MPTDTRRHTAFTGHRLLASGDLHDVALAVHRALAADPQASLLVFSDDDGRQVDLDLRGRSADVARRYAAAPAPAPQAVVADAAPRGRGRPRLGVVSREVTLLPEHWDWLGSQPGGASVVLRKLVHQARRAAAVDEGAARARERAYAFMSALAGNLPGFEEASRALFAADREQLEARTARWPKDVRAHLLRLASPDGVDP